LSVVNKTELKNCDTEPTAEVKIKHGVAKVEKLGTVEII
jgi:hypothetical protein